MNRHLLLFLATVMIFASCAAPRVYFPDRVNTPGLREKGDGNIIIAGKFQTPGSDTTFSGYDLFAPAVDVNYAFTDNFGVIASYRSLINRNSRQPGNYVYDNDEFGGVFNGNRFDLGLGFFSKLGTKGLFEVYMGGGIGNMRRRGSTTPQLDYNTDYFRYFVQPAAGFFVRERFSVMWGVRFAVQKYYNFTSNDPLVKHYITDRYYDIGAAESAAITSFTYTLAEPFVNLEIGGEHLKFTMQYGLGFRIGDSGSDLFTGGAHANFGIKVQNPHQMFNKKD